MKNTLFHFVKPVIECMGIAALAFLSVNAISFLIKICMEGWSSQDSFRFKHGTFYLNEQSAGLVWGEGNANGFLLLFFVASIIYYYHKGKFPVDKIWDKKAA